MINRNKKDNIKLPCLLNLDIPVNPVYFFSTLLLALSDDSFSFRLFQKLLRLDDVSGDGRSRDHVGRGQIEFARPAATGEIAILRADRHGFSRLRRTRPGVDARAATRINQLRSGLLKNLYVAALACVLLDLLRTELQVEMHSRRDPPSLFNRLLENARVHIHVSHLAARA